MFGKNPVEKQVIDLEGRLRLVAQPGGVFRTVQGEGPYAGHRAIFIRLHGCNLRCWFCDTQFSEPEDPTYEIDYIENLIHEQCLDGAVPGLVVITGGEPFRQNIWPLIDRMNRRGCRVQIETAGTLWVDPPGNFFGPRPDIIVSPKTPKIHPEIQRHATAYKYVIRAEDIEDGPHEIQDGLPVWTTQAPVQEGGSESISILFRPPPLWPEHKVYVSPMDEHDEERNALNRRTVAQLAIKHGYIAGLQLHKFFQVD